MILADCRNLLILKEEAVDAAGIEPATSSIKSRMLYQLSYASAMLQPLWGRGDSAREPDFRGVLRATTLKRIAHIGV